MNKSPEEYFKEQNFDVEKPNKADGLSSAEKAFMDKYVGVDGQTVISKLGLNSSTPHPEAAADLHKEMEAETPLDDMLRDSPELLMVGFFIGGQEFTIPAVAVQEVIRNEPVAKLPSAPEFVAGVINLRGRVTPLIHLRDVLEVASPRKGEDKFIIVCRRKGIQIGMIIERVHTMYKKLQADIDWSIEAHIGANVDFISGLLKVRDQLVGIVSVDKVIASILK
ncbi:MAG: chemotaxis protein CheW [Desulfovibrio sp.]|jgi:purine-binding chemotaxis protein CheW|nr:chemotaxis protein CheW [Desulfovibrio sp.]